MTETPTTASGLELARTLLEGDRALHLLGDHRYAAAIAAVTGAADELQRLTAQLSQAKEEIVDLFKLAQGYIRLAGERFDETQRLIAERDELAARLEAIERAEPVAWIEHELQGTGARHLHFERRPYCLRDDVIAPVWTALIARPEHSGATRPPAAEPEKEGSAA